MEVVRKASDAQQSNSVDRADWMAAELARHLPGLAPVIRIVWEQATTVSVSNPGACCTVAEGFEP
jgi:hypothetical protein